LADDSIIHSRIHVLHLPVAYITFE